MTTTTSPRGQRPTAHNRYGISWRPGEYEAARNVYAWTYYHRPENPPVPAHGDFSAWFNDVLTAWSQLTPDQRADALTTAPDLATTTAANTTISRSYRIDPATFDLVDAARTHDGVNRSVHARHAIRWIHHTATTQNGQPLPTIDTLPTGPRRRP